MSKKYLFLFVLFCFVAFSFNTCYGVDLSKITGFDGNTYYLNSVPSVADNYNYFIVVKASGQFHILCFNDSIEITKDSSRFYISGDEGVTLEKISCNFEGASFVDRGNVGSVSYSLSSASVIYSCDELLEYASSMRNDTSFTFPSSFVVSKSVQDVNFSDVLKEVLSILPVVLTVLISFTAIRKGISFIRKILVKS